MSTRMVLPQLGIIEEGLQLKLELHNIKRQFAGLLHNFQSYERSGKLPADADGAAMVTGPRERVRAVYAARRDRLLARNTETPVKPARRRRSRQHHDKENVCHQGAALMTIQEECTRRFDSPDRRHCAPCNTPAAESSADELSTWAADSRQDMWTTRRSLRDISQISQMSRASLRERTSSSNLSGAFHSTFNYPLHSTLNYPLHSTAPLKDSPTEDVQSHHSLRLSCDTPPSPLDNQQADQRSTDKLCSEHGLHPHFDGPCIFQSAPTSPVREETDCDSSYLSECVDELSFGGMTADERCMYDTRAGGMRMLKRQTAQTKLDPDITARHPLGLSESDFLMDATQRDASIDATCASMPDITGLTSVLQGSADVTLNVTAVVKPDVTLVANKDAATPQDDSSPASHGVAAPMNSPITDSGSSRPADTPSDEPQPPRTQRRRHVSRSEHDLRPTTRRRRPEADSGVSTAGSRRARHRHNAQSVGGHVIITEAAGSTRTVVQHSAVAGRIPGDRKRTLARRLKRFSCNFYSVGSSAHSLQLHTLGHF